MSIADSMADYQPDEREQAVLDVLREEWRANPYLIRQQVDIRKQYVNDALKQLVKAQLVRKVTDGLYEYAGDDAPDVSKARRHLEDAIRAAERGDHRELRDKLQATRDALGSNG